jgi:hypothetical protein
MRFKDIKFDRFTSRTEDGVRAHISFGKDTTLSVIREPGKKHYEIALFDAKGSFKRMEGIIEPTHYDDVLPYLTEQDITAKMLKLMLITGTLQPKQIPTNPL